MKLSVRFLAASVAALSLFLAAPATAKELPPIPAELDALHGENPIERQWPSGTEHFVHDVNVNCDKGKTISRALRRFGRQLNITFSGTCEEDVVIERDRVSLNGNGTGVIVGKLDVVSARGVTLRDFTVRGGGGIAINGGSVAVVEGVTTRSITGNGLTIDASSVRLADVVADDNAGFGVRIDRGSVVDMAGDLQVNRNGGWGFFVTANSQVLGRDFTISASDNAVAGLGFQISSGAQWFNGEIVANNNGSAGIIFQMHSVISVVGTTIQVNNNGGAGFIMASMSVVVGGFNVIEGIANGASGIVMGEGATWTNFTGTGSQMTFSDHPEFGIRGDLDAVMDLRGPNSQLTINNNQAGGVVLFNSTGRFRKLSANGNGIGDLRVEFGSRGSLFGDENDIGTIRCGAGSLIDVDAVFAGTGEIIVCDPDNPLIQLRASKSGAPRSTLVSPGADAFSLLVP